ncbi:MAG: mechanosensitive ion channel family protein [Chitinophagales bacterium]
MTFKKFFEDKLFLEMPWLIGYVLVILFVTWLFAKLFARIFDRYILRSTALINNDPTSYQFIKHLGRAFIYILGFSVAVYAIPSLRSVSTSLLAGAGILAAIVGFASQSAFSNIISGLFIIVFRPFRVNDHLIIDQTTFGVVEDVTLRHTILKSPENRRIVIPNSVMSEKIILNAHLNDPRVCKFIEVSIAYDSDMDLAMEVMREHIENHPLCIDTRTELQKQEGEPKVKVRVLKLEEYGIRLRAWCWTANNGDGFDMTCDMNKVLIEQFRIANIEIPYPHQVIIHKNTLLDSNSTPKT